MGEEDISLGQKIHFSINDDKKYFEMLIDKNRIVYTNKLYDITFIEIKQNDSLDISSFIEVDQNIFNVNENELINKSVYLLGYPNGGKSSYSSGCIKKIENDGISILHSCATCPGSAGSPILNLNNFRVIAAHQGTNRITNYNIGIFLKKPIEDFNRLSSR